METAHETFLSDLRRRGARALQRVVFRHNRTRLLSLSRDRATLNAHACFLAAPPDVLDAVARFVSADPRSAAHRRAVAVLRAWPGAEDGLNAARARHPARRAVARGAPCSASPEQRTYLRELYGRLNAEHFAGRLPPELPIRVSSRMARRLGHVRFEPPPAAGAPPRGARSAEQVLELALSADLFLDGNGRELLDTMLHEMAHVEAFLTSGHRGHGAAWKAVARRVGCEPRACTRRVIRRRPRARRRPRRATR